MVTHTYLVFKLFHKEINASHSICNIFMCYHDSFRISAGAACVHNASNIICRWWNNL